MDLPTNIKPIVVKIGSSFLKNRVWIFEPKYDGFRAMLYIQSLSATFISRSGRPLIKFQDLADKIRIELKVESAILDGEIVVINPHTQYSSITLLRRGLGQVQFAAFDLVYLNGTKLTSEPLIERKEKLAELATGKNYIFPVEYHEHGVYLYGKTIRSNWEGVVAKPKDSMYKPSADWRKFLNPAYDRKIHAQLSAKKKRKSQTHARK